MFASVVITTQTHTKEVLRCLRPTKKNVCRDKMMMIMRAMREKRKLRLLPLFHVLVKKKRCWIGRNGHREAQIEEQKMRK